MNLDTGSYFSVQVHAPGLAEQIAEAESMDSLLDATLGAEDRMTLSLEVLQELKRSLISAAVSGEFDVSSADGSRVVV